MLAVLIEIAVNPQNFQPQDVQQTVSEIGEQGLLRRVQQFCPAAVVGDDAAVLTVTPGRSLVVTEDVLVDGVHFSSGFAQPVVTTSAADVGWRAAAANLSDLAAMGAFPLGITVGLGLPGAVPVAWVEALYTGMSACLNTFNTPIVGGDICRSPILTVAIAAFGEVLPNQAIRRSTAQVGDAILVTGLHGASRAGLELLLHPERGEGLRERDRLFFIRAHQRPNPRLDVVPILQKVVAASCYNASQERYPIAGMDSSDGLADAVLQICRASGVGARLERHQLPIPPAFATWLSPQQSVDWVLYGGEDFELVLCLPLELANQLAASVPGATIVGTITADLAVILGDRTGTVPDQVLTLEKGFQHF